VPADLVSINYDDRDIVPELRGFFGMVFKIYQSDKERERFLQDFELAQDHVAEVAPAAGDDLDSLHFFSIFHIPMKPATTRRNEINCASERPRKTLGLSLRNSMLNRDAPE